MARQETKAYLGDGAYVEFDGFALWLTTEDGIRTTNRICLEPEVYRALTEYVARLKDRAAKWELINPEFPGSGERVRLSGGPSTGDECLCVPGAGADPECPQHGSRKA